MACGHPRVSKNTPTVRFWIGCLCVVEWLYVKSLLAQQCVLEGSLMYKVQVQFFLLASLLCKFIYIYIYLTLRKNFCSKYTALVFTIGLGWEGKSQFLTKDFLNQFIMDDILPSTHAVLAPLSIFSYFWYFLQILWAKDREGEKWAGRNKRKPNVPTQSLFTEPFVMNRNCCCSAPGPVVGDSTLGNK